MKSSIMNFQKKLLMRTVARVVVLRKVMNTDTSKKMEEQSHELNNCIQTFCIPFFLLPLTHRNQNLRGLGSMTCWGMSDDI